MMHAWTHVIGWFREWAGIIYVGVQQGGITVVNMCRHVSHVWLMRVMVCSVISPVEIHCPIR